MCIIVYKPKGVNMPQASTMKNCFTSNPHGAGYMFKRDNVVHIRKGFMTFEAFENDIENNVTKKDEIVFHFRIATHSKVSPENTHPFPITSVRPELHELIIDCKRALVHNGILHDFVDANDDISDSAFFAKMLYPCQREKQYKAILDCHNKTSKFVVMTSKFTLVSGQFVKKYGCSFSNYGYEDPITPVYTTCTSMPTRMFDTSGTYTGGKYNVIDDEYDKEWEKFYGVDGIAIRQYHREKMYKENRFDRRRDKQLSLLQDRKPKMIDLKTVDGKTVQVQKFGEINDDEKRNTVIINGREISFSDGVPNNTRMEIIRKIVKEDEEKRRFEDYVRYGENYRRNNNQLKPIVTLHRGTDTLVVNDCIDQEIFTRYIDEGFKIYIDGKPVGKENDIIVVANAKKIPGVEGVFVTMFDDYSVKFYRGGIDGNVVVSVRVNNPTIKPSFTDEYIALEQEKEQERKEEYERQKAIFLQESV